MVPLLQNVFTVGTEAQSQLFNKSQYFMQLHTTNNIFVTDKKRTLARNRHWSVAVGDLLSEN